MSGSVNAPSGIDMSACTVSTDGGKTSQTLAALVAAQNATATAVAQAQSAATAAKLESDQATQTATATKAAVGNLGNTYIPVTAYQQPGGPAKYDPSGLTYLVTPATSGMPQLALGSPGATNAVILKVFAGGASTDLDNGSDVTWFYRGGTAKADGAVTLRAASFGSEMDAGTALGTASNRWNGVFSNSGTIQTSDANEKTVVGVIGDPAYNDSAKLIAAGKAIRAAVTVFTFNDGGTRKHVGAIAQSVAAALTAAGLTPSDFGIWCEDLLTQQVAVKDEKGVVTGYVAQPIIDSTTGKQKVRQSLRYDELALLLIAAGEAEIRALTARVTVLESAAAPKSEGPK